MKKLLAGLLCVAWIFVVSAPAEASIKISLDPANLAAGPGGNEVSFVTGAVDPSGGNSGFLGTIWSTDGTTPLEQWETFCVESGDFVEFIVLDDRHYNIESTASTNAVATNNFVTDAAKWVYYAFGHGLLSGWDPGDGEQVQQAIWSLVQGGGSGGPWLKTATGEAVSFRNQALTAVTTAEGLAQASRIRIINPAIYTSGAPIEHHQSMLYEVIPEPTTALIWAGLGLIGLVAYRRCRKLA